MVTVHAFVKRHSCEICCNRFFLKLRLRKHLSVQNKRKLSNVELGKGKDISGNVEAFKRGLDLSLKTKKKTAVSFSPRNEQASKKYEATCSKNSEL